MIDGDSLSVGQHEIRLFGIDAPELKQTCMRAGQSWACGSQHTTSVKAAPGFEQLHNGNRVERKKIYVNRKFLIRPLPSITKR